MSTAAVPGMQAHSKSIHILFLASAEVPYSANLIFHSCGEEFKIQQKSICLIVSMSTVIIRRAWTSLYCPPKHFLTNTTHTAMPQSTDLLRVLHLICCCRQTEQRSCCCVGKPKQSCNPPSLGDNKHCKKYRLAELVSGRLAAISEFGAQRHASNALTG